MDYLNKAILKLTRLVFRTVSRKEIHETLKEVIELLEKAKKELG